MSAINEAIKRATQDKQEREGSFYLSQAHKPSGVHPWVFLGVVMALILAAAISFFLGLDRRRALEEKSARLSTGLEASRRRLADLEKRQSNESAQFSSQVDDLNARLKNALEKIDSLTRDREMLKTANLEKQIRLDALTAENRSVEKEKERLLTMIRRLDERTSAAPASEPASSAPNR